MSDEAYVLVNIISSKIQFQLKIVQGLESSNFIALIYRAIDQHKSLTVIERREFQWLQKYNGPRNAESSDSLNTDFDENVSVITCHHCQTSLI